MLYSSGLPCTMYVAQYYLDGDDNLRNPNDNMGVIYHAVRLELLSTLLYHDDHQRFKWLYGGHPYLRLPFIVLQSGE